MQLLLNCKAVPLSKWQRETLNLKTLLAMKMLCILLLAASLQLAAKGYSQTISIVLRDASLEKLFVAIEQQTDYSFVYTGEAMQQSKPVSIDVKNEILENVLRLSFADQPLAYSIEEKFIIIKIAQKTKETIDVKGRVVNETGEPVEGASVLIKGTHTGTTTDIDGYFELKDVDENVILVITGVNIETVEIKLTGNPNISISARTKISEQKEVLVNAGYYKTTDRLKTGNISRVGTEIIGNQPVSNPLAALEGRVPGLYIQQINGVPGGAFNIQIRGQNSLRYLANNNGNLPLFIIDGVPFTSTSLGTQFTNGIIRGGNPLNSINPSDIESIEILKDADATAIYGSRGANGIILITTKKGKIGKTNLNVNVYTGLGKVTRKINLLNTQQYLQMRHEAFGNDGAVPGPSDYDINGSWDTTRNTDWQKVLIGGTAHITDAQASFSGGNSNIQFLIGGGFHKETTVFPGNFADQKGSAHFSLTDISDDKKFNLSLSANYLVDNNTLPQTDLSSFALSLPPDAPPIFDGNGSLNWSPGFSNPYAYLKQKYKGYISNLIGNALIGYLFIPGLQLKANFGYSKTGMNEKNLSPLSSFDPGYGATSGNSRFGNTDIKNWIVEPQTEYKTNIFGGNLIALLGISFQEEKRQTEVLDASGFSTDELIENLAAASKIIVRYTNYAVYRYNAVFGRINYDRLDKYLINITARRDGSSRFGARKQFANFCALGAGWIFSNEKFTKYHLPFLTYGKLRASYGTTGSDQIPDYGFLDTYTPTSLPYQGSSIIPTRLANSNYSWEKSRKFEIGLELGFLKDRILFSANWYRNRSSNQLVGYPLPLITGFSSVQYNLPAVVENTGLEMELHTTNLKKANVSWTTTINFTMPRNKLISYPNLAASSFANTYEVGKSLFIQKLFHYVGIDPQTGIYEFESVNNRTTTPTPDYPGDLKSSKKIGQIYYGGFQNSLKWKGWQVEIFLQVVKQKGFNYWYGGYISPGMMINQPKVVLNHWQKPGDQPNIGQFTQDFGSAAYSSYNIGFSDYAISDASFIRLKNLSLSYNISDKWKKAMHIQNGMVYLQGQNLFTMTNYLGLDPESQIVSYLPPLWILTAGIQLTF